MKLKIRSQSGSIMVPIAVVAFMFLLPLGLFSFEISRLYLAQIQLRNAVDAAALGAATATLDPQINAPNLSQAEVDQAIQNLALKYFQRNLVTSQSLAGALFSSTCATDNPVTNQSTFNLTIDHQKGQVTAQGAFGLQPAFSKFLGINTSTIRANSLAGFSGLDGDIVIALDISDSMTLGTGLNGPGSYIVSKQYNNNAAAGTYKLNFKTLKAGTSHTPPSLRTLGNHPHAIPNPDNVDFTANPLWSSFQSAPHDVKLALLFEAKQGNLNSQIEYDKNHVGDSVLGDPAQPWKAQIKVGQDYRAAYQQAALPCVHPLVDAKNDVSAFIEQVAAKNPNVHVGLVGFAPYAGGDTRRKQYKDGQDSYDTYSTSSTNAAHIPVVQLDQGKSKSQESKDAMKPCVTFAGTNTTDALKVAHAMLKSSSQHRSGVPQTIILLTDGVPTVGGYKAEAKKIGKDGIKILAIGFFHTSYAKNVGPRVCQAIVHAAGSGSHYYPADGSFSKKNVGAYSGDELKQLEGDLSLISKGEPGLVNQ